VVMDSLSGFEIALAQTVRDEFRESLYRMVTALTRVGVTVLMTVEVTEEYTSLRFSPHAISFLTDDIVLQRYVELNGGLQKVLAVVKMRGSGHSKKWHEYDITDRGLVLGQTLEQFRGIISGIPVPREDIGRGLPGLTEREMMVLRVLERFGPATADTVADELDIPVEEVQSALERLRSLDHVLRQEADGKTVYRPAARTLKG
jgi:hypothetical protein